MLYGRLATGKWTVFGNVAGFPENFMFQLTQGEVENLRSQIVTLEIRQDLMCQNGTSRSNFKTAYFILTNKFTIPTSL